MLNTIFLVILLGESLFDFLPKFGVSDVIQLFRASLFFDVGVLAPSSVI